jgi:GT2 family glycosyltransferase
MSKDNLKLSVIVLFYYGERWIRACIDSLANQSLSRNTYEIILVDNGGSTPSVGKQEGQPNVKVLYFPKNLGFAGGNNMALARAEGEYILLMNQDVVVHFDCLREIVSALELYSHAGVISANMLLVSSTTNIDPCGSTPKSVGFYRLTRWGYASYMTAKTNAAMVPVEVVSGNALCFRRRILVDVGNYLFDERLRSYAEDLDLSIRLQKTRWQMYVCTNAVVYHYRDEAFSGRPVLQLQKLFHISSNRLTVYYNNLPINHFLIKLPALLLGIPLKVSRPDGVREVSLLKSMIALACTPFVFVYFIIRRFQISKTE